MLQKKPYWRPDWTRSRPVIGYRLAVMRKFLRSPTRSPGGNDVEAVGCEFVEPGINSAPAYFLKRHDVRPLGEQSFGLLGHGEVAVDVPGDELQPWRTGLRPVGEEPVANLRPVAIHLASLLKNQVGVAV
jgi:hypothetical protein